MWIRIICLPILCFFLIVGLDLIKNLLRLAFFDAAGNENNFRLEGFWHKLLNLMSMPVRRLFSRVLSLPIAVCNRLIRTLFGYGGEWFSQITPTIVLGALPFLPWDPQALHAMGVRAVVNTCDEYAGQTERYAQLGIQQLYIPLVDCCPPSLEDIVQVISFINSETAKQLGPDHARGLTASSAGKKLPSESKELMHGEPAKVLVHCRAGKGRSATLVLCYLMWKMKMGRREAQSFIEQHRKISSNVYNRPVVLAFEQLLIEQPNLLSSIDPVSYTHLTLPTN